MNTGPDIETTINVIRHLETENERLKESHKKLHRRTQLAETALKERGEIDRAKFVSGNFGRALLTWDCEQKAKQIDRLKGLLKEVSLCGYTDIDPRIDYLEVQIDREIWAELQKCIKEKANDL